MPGTRVHSLPDCRPLLADPDDLTLVFEPVADLAGARIAGYRALARFPGTAGPDTWFAAAAECGVRAELEALALGKALDAVRLLPADTFLGVGVTPSLLHSEPVQEVLAGRPDLSEVVLAFSQRSPVDDPAALRRVTAELRARGARIALDDAGAGCSGLQQMAELRPQVVTLDRALVTGADRDPVRTALAELVGEFAGRIDAWLLAEDLETPGELAAVLRLGARLGRGWLVGRPAPYFLPLAPDVVRLLVTQAARARGTGSVAGLMRPARQCGIGEPRPGVPPAVLVGPLGEPVGLLLADARTGATFPTPVSLRVPPSADVGETLQRALSRPPAHRFDPVVCTDPTGAVLGLLRIEDLAVARSAR